MKRSAKKGMMRFAILPYSTSISPTATGLSIERIYNLLLFTQHALKVLFVVITDRLQQIAVQKKLRHNRNRPRFGIRLGIVECDLNLHAPKVSPPKALGHPQSFAVGVAGKIKPGFVVISGRFHYQRVAFPMSDGVSHEGRIRILRKNAAIRKDLPIDCRVLIEDHYQAWSLDQLPGNWK